MNGVSASEQPAAALPIVIGRLLRAASIGAAMLTGGNVFAGDGDADGPGSFRPDTLRAANGGTEPLGEAAAIPGAPSVVFDRGKLSVALENVPLRRAAAELSRHTGIEIRFVGQAPAVSVDRQFSGYPVEKALRLLLNDVNTVFVYADPGEHSDSKGRITRIFILPKGAPGDAGRGTTDLADTLTGVAERIRGSMPRSPAAAQPGTSTNATHADEALDAVAEQLREMLLNLGGPEAPESNPAEALDK